MFGPWENFSSSYLLKTVKLTKNTNLKEITNIILVKYKLKI